MNLFKITDTNTNQDYWLGETFKEVEDKYNKRNFTYGIKKIRLIQLDIE
jgi:hypothetical protein